MVRQVRELPLDELVDDLENLDHPSAGVTSNLLLAPDVFGAHSSEAIGRRSRGPQAGSLAAPVSHRGAVSGEPMVDGGRFGHCHAALFFVLTDPDALVEDFAAAASAAAMEGWPCEIRTEILRAPHRRPPLPAGFAAVYVFALAEEYGRATPAGAGAVLKVGRVGPASGPRFSYQHYGFAAPSTLAKSLVRYRIMWPWLGIDVIDDSSVKPWMLKHLDRAHFYLPAGHDLVLASLEMYIRARVGSVFEGAA